VYDSVRDTLRENFARNVKLVEQWVSANKLDVDGLKLDAKTKQLRDMGTLDKVHLPFIVPPAPLV
jgi:hypothetical protein